MGSDVFSNQRILSISMLIIAIVFIIISAVDIWLFVRLKTVNSNTYLWGVALSILAILIGIVMVFIAIWGLVAKKQLTELIPSLMRRDAAGFSSSGSCPTR